MAWKKPIYDFYPKVEKKQLLKVVRPIYELRTNLEKFSTDDLRLMRIDAEGTRYRYSDQTLLAVIMAFYLTYLSDLIVQELGIEGFARLLTVGGVLILVAGMMAWFSKAIYRATHIIGVIDLIFKERNE